MNAVGRIGSYISRSVYTVSAPFHPFGGAVDIIVVEQQDGSFKSSPWYVRFGKFQGVLKAREKVVSISVNGVEADFNMYLDHKGEAYFLRDVEFEEVDGGSALCSPSSSSEDADEQSQERERKPGLKSKSCNYDAYEATSLTKIEVSNGKVLARTNSRRSRIMGLVFGKKPSAKMENAVEGEGASDSNVDRSKSLERAEIAADLLEVKWSTNLASPRCKKESGSGVCSEQSLECKDSEGSRLNHEGSDDTIDGSDESLHCIGGTEQVYDETAWSTGFVWEVNSEAETGFSGNGPLSVGDASENQDAAHEKATVSPHSFGNNFVSECSDDTTYRSDDIIPCSGGAEQATGLVCKVNSESETGFSGKEPLSIEDASESRDASGFPCNRDAHEEATVSPHSSRNYFVSDGTTDGSDDTILCSGGTEQVYVETVQTMGLVCGMNSETETGFSGKEPFLSVGDASESQDASGFPCDKSAHENATVSPHSFGNNFVRECREGTTDGLDDIILHSRGTEQVYVEPVQTTGLVCEVNSLAETGFSGKELLSIEDVSESQDTSHENATVSPHSPGNNFVSECSDDTTNGLNDIILRSGGIEQVYVGTVQTTGLVCQVNSQAETGFTGNEPLSIEGASEIQDALGFPCDKNAHENATVSPRSLGNNIVSETYSQTVTLQPVYGCIGGIDSQSIVTISTVTSQALPKQTGPGEDEQAKYDSQMKSLGSPIHVLTSEISEEEHLLFGDFDDLKFTSVGDKEEPISPKSDVKEADPQLLNIELEEKFSGKLKSVSSQINIPATRDQSDADLRIARSLPIMSSNNCSFGVNDSESLSTSHITRNETETDNRQSHSGQTAEDASTTTDPSIGTSTITIGTDGEKDHTKSKVNNKKKTRSICPTTKQLASLNLKGGSNTIIFTFSTPMLGKQQVDARIYLWKWDTRVVISDVDGTITRSDLLGQVMPWVGVDWSHIGVTHLFSAIKENGYQMLFLSARAISQAYLTRQFLFNLKQDGKVLPEGPVVISPDGLFPSLYREVVRRAPHEFKIACLEEIKALFPADRNPFYAGFGNRDTDEISYLKVGIPKGKIFIINPKGEVVVNRRVDKKSYTSLHTLVHDMFPPTTSSEQEDFNCWNYWKLPDAYEL